VLGIVRLRPQTGQDEALRAELNKRLDPATLDGIISMHLIESDAGLSGPTAEIPSASTGSGDWYVLIDGAHTSAVSSVLARFTGAAVPATQVSSGIYNLMWDLANCDIPRA
jgi:hypothetical protein